ncbi:hypothetical protein BOTBODRAFT_27554 [Botryobasidium botryosum FD-172 SS1]|uniref:Glucose-methanol-choline oxidoreductase N-terminal domain-containing protein n=1 Tax=Botryobasidium botryosum (strain FD-172 SS1) TaxID=930990 RepID=A0A067MWZ9_BOTB1|nr:hypothetical protein BOTBODRAFT_27554 [Botryobasidium botryosum FD-172 SS1]
MHSMATIDEVAGGIFDYVIIGGGTAGLALAVRLTEDPAVTVCVLEAGQANLNDPSLLIPGQFGAHFGNPQYSWLFKTIPQPHSNYKVFPWARGKGLGGSSAINFFAHTHPPAHDADSIERLGNPGWNWERYLRYAKKAERFTPPKPEDADKHGLHFNLDAHGTNGPVRMGFVLQSTPSEKIVTETLHNLGISRQSRFIAGDPTGTHISVASIDTQTGTRSYSANAYYAPNANRANLTVLTDAYVNKLVLTHAMPGEEVTATGVEFSYESNTFTVNASKEVVLCAGALKSPQILELSGIGDPSVLNPLDIDVRVNLPAVGTNVQEHVAFRVSYELEETEKWASSDAAEPDPAHTDERLQALRPILAFLPLQALNPAAVDSISASITPKLHSQTCEGLKAQWALQLETLRRNDVPDCEIIVFSKCSVRKRTPPGLSPPTANAGADEAGPEKQRVALIASLNHPFSRGTIHITSRDPTDHPAVDPHCFEQEEDLEMLLEMAKWMRKLPETEPFKSMVAKEVVPGPECVSDDQLKDFIKNHMETTFHTAGSCSMLPREKGGVVDPQLKVYGTSNVRVVDLSVLPLHVMAHTQAVVYSIAEQAADIIKGVIQ